MTNGKEPQKARNKNTRRNAEINQRTLMSLGQRGVKVLFKTTNATIDRTKLP